MVVAAPGVVVTGAVAFVKVDDVKLSVRAPAVPAIARFVNVATPLAFVVAVTVPCSVPPPVEIAAVTVVPAVVTVLEFAS